MNSIIHDINPRTKYGVLIGTPPPRPNLLPGRENSHNKNVDEKRLQQELAAEAAHCFPKKAAQCREWYSSRALSGGAKELPTCFLLKAPHCVIYGLVEESPHEALEFPVAMQVNSRIHHAADVNVLLEMVFGQAQRVNDLAERNPFCKPPLPQLSVNRLNSRFGFVAEPSSKVAINIIGSMVQLFTSKDLVMWRVTVAHQITDETVSQLLRVILNYSYQASGEHSAPPSCWLALNLQLSSWIPACLKCTPHNLGLEHSASVVQSAILDFRPSFN